MRLSEAIRLGAMASGQADGVFWDDGKTCANGAALLAVGKLNKADSMACWMEVAATWPWASTTHTECPVCVIGGSVQSLIPHLNNSRHGAHGWTREQIADWVQTIEPAEAISERPRASTADGLQALSAESESVGVK